MQYNLFHLLIKQKLSQKTPPLTEMLFKTANGGSEKLGNVKTISSPEAVINPLHVSVTIQFYLRSRVVFVHRIQCTGQSL